MMLVVNLKNYIKTQEEVVAVAQELEKVAKEKNISLTLAVPAVDISAVAKAVTVPVFAQSTSETNEPNTTGSVLAVRAKSVGAAGTLIHHAECQVQNKEACLATAKQAGLATILCVKEPSEIVAAKGYAAVPDYVAVEPPELIGGTVSVTTAQPELITESVAAAGDLPVLVGAGIKTAADVVTAKKLGAAGCLLASAVAAAEHPGQALHTLFS